MNILLKVLSPLKLTAAGLAAVCGVGAFLLGPQAEAWLVPLLAIGLAIALAGIWTIDARSIATRASLSAIPLLAFGGAYGWLGSHLTIPDEDVRVSLDLERVERHMVSYRFTFANVGLRPATVDAMALFEMDATASEANPLGSLARCRALSVKQFGLHEASDDPGEQGTVSHYRVYRPVRISVDHRPPEAMHAIAIGSASQVVVTGVFALDRARERQFATNVLCPAVSTQDARGADHVSICPGFVMMREATDETTESSWFAPATEVFRLLPASAATRCPPA